MTEKNTFEEPKKMSIVKPVVIGAAIGLALISLFLSGVDQAKPEWGKYWMIRPMIIVPLAGAMGGFGFVIMDYLSTTMKFHKAIAVVLSIIGFIITLWLGTVLGLDGTLWN